MLKGDRNLVITDISFWMNQTAVRGGVLTQTGTGSGAALDQASALVAYSANPSGLTPVGILLGDVVNYDLTRQHANYYKDETQLGGKISFVSKGWVVTNNILPGITPAGGDIAFVDNSGFISSASPTAALAVNVANKPRIGKFLSDKDEDGYAKVYVDL